jgi:hypothetical protein
MSTTETNLSPPTVAMPTARDALYRFVQDRLLGETGQTIAEFILVRREPGSEVPYRRIASEIVELTGIDITHEAARRWYHLAVKARDERGASDEEDRVTRIIQEAQAREAAAADPITAALANAAE